MEVTIITLSDKGLEACDWKGTYAIKFDAKTVFSVMDGEPEDNNISRNFSDVYSIPKLLQEVYEAGKRDEQVTFNRIQVDSDDDI